MTRGSASECSMLCPRIYSWEGELWLLPRKLQRRLPPKSLPQRNPRQRNPPQRRRQEKAPLQKSRAQESGTCKKPAAKRKPNAAFMKPMTPSANLASVVGPPLPRTEVTKKIWDYIKKNKLQDPENKRQINADEKLRAVFGGKKSVSMFEMTKLVSGHLK